VAASEEVDWRFVRLPRRHREEPRGSIVGRLRGLGIVAAHLSTRRSARDAQVPALLSLARELGRPVVLLGDFNSSRDGLGALTGAGFDPGAELATMVRGRARQLDYIFAGEGVRLVERWTVPSRASDHLPLVADLEY
jgi:endonuclease/exonuclease/phosphatase family metal-dependent hydrolase